MAASIDLTVTGMKCEGCAAAVKRALSAVTGVARVDVDLAAGRVQVEGTPKLPDVISALKVAGYGAQAA